MSVCLCLPFANHEWSALSSATKNKKSDEKERLLRKKIGELDDNFWFLDRMRYWFVDRKRSSTLSFPLLLAVHCTCSGKKEVKRAQDSHAFQMRARRTLQALKDTASVLAFPFKIFEEGPSLSLRKGESAYMYGDGKQTNPRACHGEARLPASCCELLLPSFVWRASMHTAGRKQRSLFL